MPMYRGDELRARIKELAERHDITLTAWPVKANLSKNVLHNLINGHTQSLQYSTFAKLAEAIGVSLEELTGPNPSPPSDQTRATIDAVKADEYPDIPSRIVLIAVEVLEEFVQRKGKQLDPARKAGIVIRLCHAAIEWESLHKKAITRDQLQAAAIMLQ